jgi:hypothetical protein
VRLVHHEQADPRRADALEEAWRAEALGRDVEQAHVAAHRKVDRAAIGRRVLLGVDQRDAPARNVLEPLDLVLHQRHQRRDHERQVRPHQRRELVAERLARARGHHDQHVPIGQRGRHGLPLAGPEAGEAEELVQRPFGIGGARDRRRRLRPQAGQRGGEFGVGEGVGGHGLTDPTGRSGGPGRVGTELSQTRAAGDRFQAVVFFETF